MLELSFALLIILGAASSLFYTKKNITQYDVTLSFNTVAAVFLYLLTNLIRSFRLRIVVSENSFTLKDAALVQYLSTVAGITKLPLIKELSAIFLFNLRFPRHLPQIVIALIYTRFCDLLVLTPLFLAVSRLESVPIHPLIPLLLSLLIMTLGLLLLIPRFCDLFISHFLKHHHTPKGVTHVKIIANIKSMYHVMKLNRIEIMAIVFILTLISWLIEFVMVRLALTALGKSSFIETSNIIMSSISTNFPFLQDYQNLHFAVYQPIFLGLIIFSICFVTFTVRQSDHEISHTP